MKISDVLSPAMTLCDLPGASKKRVLENLSALITEQLGGDAEQTDQLFHSLVARERLGSTGIGEGVAIPHCRLDECQQATALLIQLNEPIDFDAIDSRPVDLLFVLLVPSEACDQHLQTLSTLAELFSQENFRNRLRDAATPQALYTAATEYISE